MAEPRARMRVCVIYRENDTNFDEKTVVLQKKKKVVQVENMRKVGSKVPSIQEPHESAITTDSHDSPPRDTAKAKTTYTSHVYAASKPIRAHPHAATRQVNMVSAPFSFSA